MQTRKAAAFGSAAFFVLAPGGVAGLIPWPLTGQRVERSFSFWAPFQAVGLLVLLTALAVLVSSFTRFVVEGFGTPALVAPPDRLLIGGFYRDVRNPMYLAVLSTELV